MKFLKVINTFLLTLLLSALLSACGSDSDDDPVTGVQSGQFLDSAVEGLRYQTATQSGTTDQNGTFRYQVGEAVTFFLGDIELGSVAAASVITPGLLTTGALDDKSTATLNMVRILMSLDSIGTPDDGITLSDTVRNAVTGITDNIATADLQAWLDALTGVTTTVLINAQPPILI